MRRARAVNGTLARYPLPVVDLQQYYTEARLPVFFVCQAHGKGYWQLAVPIDSAIRVQPNWYK